MSLDTVIKIGKQYRQAKNSWKYHDQVSQAIKDVDLLSKKKDKDGNNIKTVYYELDINNVGDNYKMDIKNIHEITNEDKQKSIYYLNFKANKKDSFKKYLIGDIVYSCYIDNKGAENESGNYRMKGQWNGDKKSSFWKCEDIIKNVKNPFIVKFRNAFKNNIDEIEKVLSKHQSVVLHFNFDGKQWLDFDGIIDSIDDILCKDLVSQFGDTNKVILEKYLYKTLGGSTPNFIQSNSYKNRLFNTDEIKSLLYASKATEKPLIRIGNIGIIALPHSELINAEQVVDYFERDRYSVEEEVEKETNIEVCDEPISESDSLFTEFIENNFDDKIKFDIVFTNIPSSPSGVFSDMIEISDVEKSLLKRENENILNQRKKIEALANKEISNVKKTFNFQVRNSYLKIFGDVTKDKKKYRFHLLKIIPQIYTDTYYSDPLLLPTFINKVEYNIRNDGQGFGILKYDFYFLNYIQKNNILMNITESKSYALGKALGTMARPFAAWRDNCPIKSFEKNYVGNLSRRSTSINDLVKFAAFINEKLVMHERLHIDESNAYADFTDVIKNFGNEKYSKDNFALGFFESYFGKRNNNNQ